MKELFPDKKEILRYMGYGDINNVSYIPLIDECLSEIEKVYRPRYVYKVFDIEKKTSDGEKYIKVLGTNLCLCGNDIYAHLKNSKKCAVMAATLGIEVDNLIRRTQNSDMLKALTFNACATELIEKLCDKAENEIKAIADKNGDDINFRFSPGYGDLPIDTQEKTLLVLDAMRKIGLTVTKNSIMIPSKSVTAIIGFVKKDSDRKSVKSSCDICSMRDNCMFKKGGTTCERGRIYKA